MSFKDEFDEDLGEDIGVPVPSSKTPAGKTPTAGGKNIALYFTSTIGPGEKKQKLTINDGNAVNDIKRTVGNMFGLNPADFHLSSGGVTMDDGMPLNNYSISNGDEVLLIPASTAGSK
jgi:hypothetical protein